MRQDDTWKRRYKSLPSSSIDSITPQGMSDMSHMHSDLMRSACIDPHSQQGISHSPIENAPLTFGRLAIFDYSYLNFDLRMSAERRIHNACLWRRSLNQREIFLMNFTRSKGF